MIYSIFGFGKMKTEASVGLTIRGIANHDEVLFAQFLKDGSSLEANFLNMFSNCHVRNTDTKGFTYDKETEKAVNDLYDIVLCAVTNDEVKLVILDEILVCYDMNYVTYKKIKSLIYTCKEHNIDVCMTGRINSKLKRTNITMISDIVTNAYAIKHWFNSYCDECKCEYEYHYKFCPKCGAELRRSVPPKKGRDY